MFEAFPECLRDVEFALGVDSAEYVEFTQLIGDLQIRRTGIVHPRSRMEEILKNYPILLDQFKRFSQQGYDEPTPGWVDFHQALKFLIMLKMFTMTDRFHGDQRYATFLGLIASFKAGTIDLQMCREICLVNGMKFREPVYPICITSGRRIFQMGELFTENLDLMEEFTAFLPSTGCSSN